MFPLKDDNPTELVPYVTFVLIGACVAVWLFVQGAGAAEAPFIASLCELGTIPAEVTGGQTAGRVSLGGGAGCELGGLTWETMITSMFLHGSWMHLIGNMWFLWIFGNNIEDSMGHLRFLVFYLLTGLLASGAHVASDPTSLIPTVGASGAISGILGAYLLLYPKARVSTLIFLVIFIKIIKLPAGLFLGLWFAIQLFSSFAPQAEGGGGVAFWAHIGGFIAGLVLIKLFANRQLVDAKHRGIVLDPSELRGRGWW